MYLIGVDYHPDFQQVAFFNQDTGECCELHLNHSSREAEGFYRELHERGGSVRVGMEATGYSRWFERLLAELGFEVWIGDPAQIKTKRVQKFLVAVLAGGGGTSGRTQQPRLETSLYAPGHASA